MNGAKGLTDDEVLGVVRWHLEELECMSVSRGRHDAEDAFSRLDDAGRMGRMLERIASERAELDRLEAWIREWLSRRSGGAA